MTTGKSLRRVEATGPMVARAVAMEEAVSGSKVGLVGGEGGGEGGGWWWQCG